MPKSLADTLHDESAEHYMFGRFGLGMAWGGFAGAMIGAGISMTIGLFYSSATSLIVLLITVSSVFGALFGQIMAGLLADDGALKGYGIASYNAPASTNATVAMTDLCEHKALKSEQNNKIISNQDVMSKINMMRSTGTTLPHYPDSQVFELIVSQARKTSISADQGHIQLKTLS